MRRLALLLLAGCGRELFLPAANVDGTAKTEILMVGREGRDAPDETMFFDLDQPFSRTFEIGEGTRFEAMTFAKTTADLGLLEPDHLGTGRGPDREDYAILEATVGDEDEIGWTPASEGRWSGSVKVPGRCADLQLIRQEPIPPTNFAGLVPRNGKAISIQRSNDQTFLLEISRDETRPLAAPEALAQFAARRAFGAIDGSIIIAGDGGYLRLTGDPIDGAEEIPVPGETMFPSTMTEDGAIFGLSGLNRLYRVESAGVSVLQEFSADGVNPKLGGIAPLGAQDVLVAPLDGRGIFRYRLGTIMQEVTEIDDLLSMSGDVVGALVDVPGTGTFAGTNERVLERRSEGWSLVVESPQVFGGVRIGVIAPFRGGIVISGDTTLIQYYRDEGLCLDQRVSMGFFAAEFALEIDGGIAFVGYEVAGTKTAAIQVLSD
jgi:hypothetical protein